MSIQQKRVIGIDGGLPASPTQIAPVSAPVQAVQLPSSPVPVSPIPSASLGVESALGPKMNTVKLGHIGGDTGSYPRSGDVGSRSSSLTLSPQHAVAPPPPALRSRVISSEPSKDDSLHAQMAKLEAIQPTQEPPINRKQVEALLNESLKLVVSNIDESLTALESKMEAVIQQRLIPISTKIDESVTQLEGRIAGLMETSASWGALLEQHTDTLAAHERLLLEGGIGNLAASRVADTSDFEARLQALQVQLEGSVREAQGPASDAAPLQRELGSLSKQVEELQAQSVEMQENLQKTAVALQDEARFRSEEDQRVEQLCSSMGSVAGSPSKAAGTPTKAAGSPTNRSGDSTPGWVSGLRSVVAELEIRVDKVEGRLGAVAEQQPPEGYHLQIQEQFAQSGLALKSHQGQAMEEIARVERMCAQLENLGLEARDETDSLRSTCVQLHTHVLTLETQLEGLRTQLMEELRSGKEQPASVNQAQLQQAQDDREALRALEGEVQLVRADTSKLSAQVENAAKDFLLCRRSTDYMQDNVKSIEERLQGHGQSTELAQNKVKSLEERLEGLQVSTTQDKVKSLEERLEGLQASTTQEKVKSLEERLEGLQVSTTQAHVRLDESIRGSVAAVQSDTFTTTQELEQIRGMCARLEAGGEEVRQLQQALGDLQERTQNSQESATLQREVQLIAGRVDSLTESQAGHAQTAQDLSELREILKARMDKFMDADAVQEAIQQAHATMQLRSQASVDEGREALLGSTQALGEELRGRIDLLQDNSDKLRSQLEASVLQRSDVSKEFEQEVRGQVQTLQRDSKEVSDLLQALQGELQSQVDAVRSHSDRGLLELENKFKSSQEASKQTTQVEASSESLKPLEERLDAVQEQSLAVLAKLEQQRLDGQGELQTEANRQDALRAQHSEEVTQLCVRLQERMEDLQSQQEQAAQQVAREVPAPETAPAPILDVAARQVLEQVQTRMDMLQARLVDVLRESIDAATQEKQLRTTEVARITAASEEHRKVTDSMLQLVSNLQAQSDAMRDQLAETMREGGGDGQDGDATERIDSLQAGLESLIGDHVETRANVQQAITKASESQNTCLQLLSRLEEGDLCTSAKMETVVVQLMAEGRAEWQAALEEERAQGNGRAQVLGRALGEEFARSTASQAVVQARVEMQSMLSEEMEKLQANGALGSLPVSLPSTEGSQNHLNEVQRVVADVGQNLSSKVENLMINATEQQNEVRAELERSNALVRSEIDVVRSLQQLSSTSLEAVQERLQTLEVQIDDRRLSDGGDFSPGEGVAIDANIKAGLQEMFQEIQAHAVKLDQLQHELIMVGNERDAGLQALSDHVVGHISSLVSKLNDREGMRSLQSGLAAESASGQDMLALSQQEYQLTDLGSGSTTQYDSNSTLQYQVVQPRPLPSAVSSAGGTEPEIGGPSSPMVMAAGSFNAGMARNFSAAAKASPVARRIYAEPPAQAQSPMLQGREIGGSMKVRVMPQQPGRPTTPMGIQVGPGSTSC